MKNKHVKISIIILAVLLLSNLFSGYINLFTDGLFKTNHYQTESTEFEFTTMPSKGRDIEMMKRNFAHFKDQHPEYKDLQLFRTFKRNPIKFWNWYAYLSDDIYRYEYIDNTVSNSKKGKFGI
ncbi:hypothetical protein [Hanstruepera marina]|uniref:hypothetical protein n=1 Tax=Hanstruepera marina TaxID=2873265 RepID=UPI001CA7749F|nr:hypothetical protein [Hanstruepera marina]